MNIWKRDGGVEAPPVDVLTGEEDTQLADYEGTLERDTDWFWYKGPNTILQLPHITYIIGQGAFARAPQSACMPKQVP